MAALKKRISEEMKTALLGGDRFCAGVLNGVKAAILDQEIAMGQRETGLSDEEVEKIIVREVKKRNESIKLYRDNGRDDLADNEEKELKIIQEFLPKQLTEAEITKIVDEIIANTPNATIKQMGQIIGGVKQKTGNSADGAMISNIVKNKLIK